MSQWEESKTQGLHARLQACTGKWKGTSKVWFGPDELVDESPVEGTIESILDDRFLLYRYQGSFQGKPLEGLAIFAYYLLLDRFQAAWVDSFHMGTGILFSESQATGAVDPEKVLDALGHYETGGAESQRWGWRTQIEVLGPDRICITAYNISPDGEEVKATEVMYERAG